MPDWKVKQLHEYFKKTEDTLNVLSKYQNWITVSTKTRNRKRPLEKLKPTNPNLNDKLLPSWMVIKGKNKFRKSDEVFKSIEYYPIKEKTRGRMILIDKNIAPSKIKLYKYNPNRSLFNYQDFRNTVTTKKEQEYFDSLVNKLPRKFFDWDDGKKFIPKYKKDV